MRRNAGIIAAAAVALALPASAVARPADVRIIGSSADPVVVEVSGRPTVKVDTTLAPLATRELPEVFGDTMKVTTANGAVACERLDLANSRPLRLDAVLAGSSAAAPTAVFLMIGGQREPGTNDYLDIPIPMTAVMGAFTNSAGRVALGFPVVGGIPGAAVTGSKLADVRACVRPPASGTSTVVFMFSGTYLNG